MRYLFLLPFFVLFSSFSSQPPVTETNKPAAGNDSAFSGKMEWDVTLRDTAGKEVSLSNFYGNFMVVDLWASWCKPCMTEMDYTRELQTSFKENNKLVWVFISFDNSEIAWKQHVRKNKLPGIHLWGTPLKEKIKADLDVRGIPRYVWIDSEGNLLLKDAPRPSDNGTERQLKYYVNKL